MAGANDIVRGEPACHCFGYARRKAGRAWRVRLMAYHFNLMLGAVNTSTHQHLKTSIH